jgi:hypothetical protein
MMTLSEIEINAVARIGSNNRRLDDARVIGIFTRKRNRLVVEKNPPVVSAGLDNNRITESGRVDCILDIIEVSRSIIIDSNYCRLRRENRQQAYYEGKNQFFHPNIHPPVEHKFIKAYSTIKTRLIQVKSVVSLFHIAF